MARRTKVWRGLARFGCQSWAVSNEFRCFCAGGQSLLLSLAFCVGIGCRFGHALLFCLSGSESLLLGFPSLALCFGLGGRFTLTRFLSRGVSGDILLPRCPALGWQCPCLPTQRRFWRFPNDKGKDAKHPGNDYHAAN